MSEQGSALPDVPNHIQKQNREIVASGGANTTARAVPPTKPPTRSAGFDTSKIHLANVQMEINPHQATVLVGPVVGKVSATDARIMLELDTSCEICLTVEPEDPDSPRGGDKAPTMGGSGGVIDVDMSPQQQRHGGGGKAKGRGPTVVKVNMQGLAKPKVVLLRKLQPGTWYRVGISGCRTLKGVDCAR